LFYGISPGRTTDEAALVEAVKNAIVDKPKTNEKEYKLTHTSAEIACPIRLRIPAFRDDRCRERAY